MHPLSQTPPPAWCSVPQAARVRGVGPDLLLAELKRRNCTVRRLGDRGLVYVLQSDLTRLDAALVTGIER